MSDTSLAPRQPLGVGAIIGDSFSILFRNIPAVAILGFVPMLISILLSRLLVGWDETLNTEVRNAEASIPALVINIILGIVLYGLVTALLVQMAYDAKLRRPVRPGAYVAPALSACIPIAVLGIATGILVGLAAIALVIPGLWVYAVFSVMPAAVVIERVGFGGLGRSAALTKGYRWPILGALVLLWICIFLLSFAANFVVGLIVTSLQPFGGIIVGVILISLFNGLIQGIGSIAVALIYARLREIKEGIGLSDIVAVFD